MWTDRETVVWINRNTLFNTFCKLMHFTWRIFFIIFEWNILGACMAHNACWVPDIHEYTEQKSQQSCEFKSSFPLEFWFCFEALGEEKHVGKCI